MLYKNKYMVPEDMYIIGLEEEGKKNKGNAEFSFTEKEDLIFPSILNNIVPEKKKELKIVVKDARRKPKSRESTELF